MDSNTCSGSGNIGHRPSEYNVVGFSPCGEYVAHESNKPCDVINMETLPGPTNDLHICMCRTDSCPCGDFISHRINEPCTAK